MRLKIKMSSVCKKCKYARWPLVLNGFVLAVCEWVCVQKDWEGNEKDEKFYTNPVTGGTIYTKCANKNCDGDCKHYEKGKWHFILKAETTNRW
jgi:hypothetical protein